MKMIKHDFYCTCCGKKGIPVWRKPNKLREHQHLKYLYCTHCKKETNHLEMTEEEAMEAQWKETKDETNQ